MSPRSADKRIRTGARRPFLFLFNPRLAMIGLIAAIVVMYIQRTRPPKRRFPAHAPESEYKPGYED